MRSLRLSSAILAVTLSFAPAVALAQSADIPADLQKTIVTIAVFAVAIYFLPTIVAAYRSHRNTTAIFIVNLFFGWTLIGFVICLAWAFASAPKIELVTVAPPVSEPVKPVKDRTVKAIFGPVPIEVETTPPIATPAQSVPERILKLKELLDAGAITQPEFELLKAEAMKGLA